MIVCAWAVVKLDFHMGLYHVHCTWVYTSRLTLYDQIADFSKCTLKSTLKSDHNYIGLISVDLQTFLGILKDYFVAFLCIKGLNKGLKWFVDSVFQ